MSWTFVACIGIAILWMALFFLWGRAFLTIIKMWHDIASSIAFGYLVLQVLYQMIYLPFYLNRGSFRVTAYTWMSIVLVLTIGMIVFFCKHREEQITLLSLRDKVSICLAIILVFGLAVYISLHVPYYGADTVKYISTMNEAYYRDSMWVTSGKLNFHFGMCSMFQLFTISSLLTGIKPYYISLFSIRILGICLFSLILYRIGLMIFRKGEQKVSIHAIILAILVPYLMMFWGSNYTAEFFYWRINEAKGYCQFVLLPLGFSVFLEMFRNRTIRKALWKEQILVGFGAVAVSASSLTPYLFLLFIGVLSLLVYDRLKDGWGTIGRAMLCALPNLIYLAVYILEKNGTIVL